MNTRARTWQGAAAVEDNALIRARLEKLNEAHPELASLISLVPRDCSLTSDFFSAYTASEINSGIKSLVLRAILGEPNLYPERASGAVGLPFYRRLAQYFEHHPKRPLVQLTADFKKEDIPKLFETVLGISRASPGVFLSQTGLVPYLLFRRGRLAEGHLGLQIKQDDDLDFLRPFYESRKITASLCQDLLTARATHHAYETYFNSGDKALDLRNMLLFLQAFWRQDRLGGRLQTKIPKIISDFFHLKRLSIPELAFLVDILPLMHLGVIDPARLDPKDDHLGLRRVLSCVKGSQIEDLEALILSHTGNGLLTEPRAESIFKNRQEGLREGTYETGFVFNLDRLLTRPAGKRFAPYYAAIDDEALVRQVNNYYRALSPAFADQLVRIQGRFSTEFSGIRIRDLSNILFYFWHHTQQGRERRGLLPAVAKFALGQREYEAGAETPSTGRRTTHRGRDQGKPHPEDHLPLLEAFLSPQSKCYLLYPGYQGPLPQDGLVYIPRIIAAGYTELPPEIRLAGPEQVTWRQDPYQREHLPEIEGFDSVIPLGLVDREEQ